MTNLDPTSRDKSASQYNTCSCEHCTNEGKVYLKMVKILASGYYCEQCANDLKYHGLFHVPADVDPLLHFYHTLTGRENEKVVVTGEA